MNNFKTLNMITIEEKDLQLKQAFQMVIERDEINYLLMEKIDKLEKQARKSICQSCVALTNQAHDQDCIIEELELLSSAQRQEIKAKSAQIQYLKLSLESAKQDTKALQKLIKGFGQAHVYAELFRKEAI